METLDAEMAALRSERKRMEETDFSRSNLIPQAERLLSSYEQMSVPERNEALKAIVKRIEYRRERGGPVEIDLYPRFNEWTEGRADSSEESSRNA
jgi:hypothetical protein